MPKHALIVGGTGMLSGVTRRLLRNYDIVSVIARNTRGFDRLENESGKLSTKLNRLVVDYADYKKLTGSLLKAIKDYGEISLCVSWVHSTAPLAPLIIAKVINDAHPADFYEVLGSAVSLEGTEKREESFRAFDKLSYHSIILGFVIEGNNSRWLTNQEISTGVIESIEKGEKTQIIGVKEPWSQKPG